MFLRSKAVGSNWVAWLVPEAPVPAQTNLSWCDATWLMPIGREKGYVILGTL